MKNLYNPQVLKSVGISVMMVMLIFLISGLSESAAQYIENNQARRDVRGTSRRTARRVDRRHDRREAAYYGNTVTTLPGGCVLRAITGINYQYCNGVYYQPQYHGTEVVYVQVEVND